MPSNIELTDIHSTIFFFTEVDDPIFCLITHLLSLALADGAFKASTLTTPKRIFKRKIRDPVLCTPHTEGRKSSRHQSSIEMSAPADSCIPHWKRPSHSLSFRSASTASGVRR